MALQTEFAQWVGRDALPFWAGAGRDDRHGGVHERLFFDGTPDLACPKRVRVQLRQIYSFSHAAVLGWYDGAGVAAKILDWTLAKAYRADGAPGFAHVLTPEGAIANPLRDTYDHAFALLALGWFVKATGDGQARGLIDTLIGFLDETLRAPDGSYLEGLPASQPRRQNPHMHLFEAMLALHDTIAYPGALKRAAALRHLFETRFLSPAPVLREFFTDAWAPVQGPDGESVEPGHQAEWCWLLRRHERLAGLAPSPLPSTLIDAAEESADGAGFLVDETDAGGAVRRASRRLWPQTEQAKAWLAEARIGRPGARENGEATLARMLAHYLGQPLPGGWIDQFDGAGKPLVSTMPASSLYHILGAAVEAEAVAAMPG